jgi:hypothetical protein
MRLKICFCDRTIVLYEGDESFKINALTKNDLHCTRLIPEHSTTLAIYYKVD